MRTNTIVTSHFSYNTHENHCNVTTILVLTRTNTSRNGT